MSPTVHREGGYRFFFFSAEEERMHVHVTSAAGECKFWLEPLVALAHATKGMSVQRLKRIQGIVEGHRHEFIAAWRQHKA